MKQRNLFKSISALLGAISVFSTAQAEDLLQSNQLRASDGQMFAVRANVEGFPNGLAYDVVLTNVETVIYQTARYFDIEVVYINDCKNYDGVPFTAYLACPAKYDPFHDRSVAKLDRSACHSSDKEFHTDFNFNTHGGWYVSGRTGYYQPNDANLEWPFASVKNGSTIRSQIPIISVSCSITQTPAPRDDAKRGLRLD